MDQKRRPMYPHFTTATDTDLVKHVFSCVADVILNEVLKTTGLQWSWSNITLDLMVFSTFDANYFESVPFNPVWIAFFPHCMTCLSYIIKKPEKNRQIAMVLCNLAGNCCDLTIFFDLKKSFYRVFLRLTVFENYPKCRILYFLYFGIFHQFWSCFKSDLSGNTVWPQT